MPFFRRVRELIGGRHRVYVLASQVKLVTRRTESVSGKFVFPGFDFVDDITVDGLSVGYVDYGISPLGDRLYINMIEIAPQHRKKGIGMSVLWILWCTDQIPIVPLNQRTSSDGFWSLARDCLAAAGGRIEAELRGTEQMECEQQRWSHLVSNSALRIM
ncbi:N-acetyltransferase [Pseudomonas syringae]|uniref:N-acetyltransferase n=1 Tax=Pseudomonas syringae TaxID=317 RepID=UPI001E3D39AE|nr:N-acetyltransferase [Pseudomonas syringae]